MRDRRLGRGGARDDVREWIAEAMDEREEAPGTAGDSKA